MTEAVAMTGGAASFDALIAAYEPGPAPGGLRALVMLAGRPLVEHQLRRARAAGADRLLLLVDDVPMELARVVTILRREGVAVKPVRGLDAAAELLPPDRAVLLVADACLADEAVLRRLPPRGAPCLLTLPDAPDHDRYERIDAGARWSGIALLDGGRVADAAAMLGSWDPISTLLRRAVQEDAPRLETGVAEDEEAPLLMLDPSEVAEADARIVAAARPRPRGWLERWVHAPLLARMVPPLVARATGPGMLVVPGAAAMLLAGGMALAGWRWPPLLLVLPAPLAIAAGRQLARVADRPVPLAATVAAIHPLALAMAGGGLAMRCVRDTGQWGWGLVGALLLVAATAGEGMRPVLRRAKPLWLGSADAYPWLLLPCAIAGRWEIGLAAMLAYAVAGFGWLWRGLLAQAAADAGLAPPKLFSWPPRLRWRGGGPKSRFSQFSRMPPAP